MKKFIMMGIILLSINVYAPEVNIELQNTVLNETYEKIKKEYEEQQRKSITWDNIDYWLEYYNIQHKAVVKQQIYLETNNLSSPICRENLNLFGMKEAKIRETTALGTKRGHAYYTTYTKSIEDYKLWQDTMYTGGEYYQFLSNIGYATDENYILKLKNLS